MKPKLIKELILKTEEKYPGIARSEIKRLYKDNLIELVNGKVNLKNISEFRDKLIYELDLPYNEYPLEIIYEDENTIIVNKDSGIATHEDRNNINALNKYVQKYLVQKSDNPFSTSQPVNRLDKDTSGLVMFSKNLAAHQFYSKQFKSHEIIKKYIAEVIIEDSKQENSKLNELLNTNSLKLANYISKYPIDRKYYIIEDENYKKEGEYAETEINLLQILNSDRKGTKKIILDLIPKTGRTHQLRVHLKSIGLAIINDPIYNSMTSETLIDKRMRLHSYYLEFLPYNQNKGISVECKEKWLD